MDGDSTGLQEGGLIGPGPRAGLVEASAVRRMPRRTPCGVWAAASPDRSTVAAIAVALDALERLGDRHDRDGGSVLGRRLDDRRDEVARRPTGRAPSWTRTTRSPSGSGTRALERVEPGADRVLPPLAARREGDGRAVRQPRPVLELPPPFRRRHDDDRRDLRAAASSAASVCASSGRPPIRASELVGAAHPRRGTGRHDDRVGRGGAALNRAAVGRRSCDRPRSGGHA